MKLLSDSAIDKTLVPRLQFAQKAQKETDAARALSGIEFVLTEVPENAIEGEIEALHWYMRAAALAIRGLRDQHGSETLKPLQKCEVSLQEKSDLFEAKMVEGRLSIAVPRTLNQVAFSVGTVRTAIEAAL